MYRYTTTFFVGALFFATSFFSIPATASAAISPYFIPSRISGVAPLAVFFDTASSTSASTTDTGVTTRPFHDLDYAWNYGDTNAGLWTYGTASSSKNIAYGPEAAHVFETPGTYTVTMTVKDGTNTAATTTTITVTDPNTVFSGTNTICVAASTLPVAGVGGCPSGAVATTTSSFNSAVATYAGTNRRVLFKGGDAFTSSSNASITTSGGTIGSYGTGKALISSTGDTVLSVGGGGAFSNQ